MQTLKDVFWEKLLKSERQSSDFPKVDFHENITVNILIYHLNVQSENKPNKKDNCGIQKELVWLLQLCYVDKLLTKASPGKSMLASLCA